MGQLAEALAGATKEAAWDTLEGKKKTGDWLEKHTTTADDDVLLEWWRSATRSEKLWTKAIRGPTTLKTYLCSLDQGPDLPAGHVKVPFTVERLRFKAWKRWIKGALDRDKRAQAKKMASAATAAAEAAQHTYSRVVCRLCECTAMRSQSGGRGLRDIRPCELHRTRDPISQLFPRDLAGQLADVCAHCVVTCIRCGCTALRDRDLIQTQSCDNSMCSKGHSNFDIKFSVRWASLRAKNAVRDTCEACRQEMSAKAKEKREGSAEVASTASASSGATSAPGAGDQQYQSLTPAQQYKETISRGDLEVVAWFSRYEVADTEAEKKRVAETICIETLIPLKRVIELCKTVLPKRRKRTQAAAIDNADVTLH